MVRLKPLAHMRRWLSWLGPSGRPNILENPNVPLSGASLTLATGGIHMSDSGEPVTTETALSLSPVWQAVSLISGDVAKLPWITYQRFADGSRRPAMTHGVYKLTKYSMGWQTSNLWLQVMMSSGLLYGNGFSEILRDSSSMPRACRFVDAHRVNIILLDNGDHYYQIHDRDGRIRDIDRRNMFHLVGPQICELAGMSLVQYARNTIGRHLSTEQHVSDFYRNNATPWGLFKLNGRFESESAKEEFARSVSKRHVGTGNRFKFGVLPKNVEWIPAGIKPQDAMLVNQLELQVKDVARLFNVPPHKLGDDSRTSYSSLEQENQSYLDSTLMPWLDRFNSEATDKFFPVQNLQGGEASYYCEFNTAALVRADLKSRMESYVKAQNNGILNANEIRALENRDAYDGGDDYYMPVNLQNITNPEKNLNQQPAQPTPEPEPEQETETQEAIRAVLSDALRRQVVKVLAHAELRAGKPDAFLEWLDMMPIKLMPELEPSLRPAAKLIGMDSKNLARSIVEPAQRLLRSAGNCPEGELKISVAQIKAPLLEESVKLIEVMI